MAIDVGDRRQLFFDTRFIENAEGIELVMNPPTLHPDPVIVPETPWEKAIGLYNTVLRDQDRFRLWYDAAMIGGLPAEGARRLCYAESLDGIHWEKPSQGLVMFQGSKENNIVAPLEERQSMQGATVYLDLRAPELEQYRLWTKFRPADAQMAKGVAPGLWAMHSPDGIHWSYYPDNPVADQMCDTQNMFFFDDRIGSYVGYTRSAKTQHQLAEAAELRDLKKYRSVERIVSPDFFNWSKGEIVFEADALDLQAPIPLGDYRQPVQVDYYNSCAIKYAWAEDAYFMFPSVFHHWEYPHHPATFDIQMLTSRDGIDWQRVGGRRPFIRKGLDGSATGGLIMMNPELIPMGDELWFYYAGRRDAHSSPVIDSSREGNSGIFRGSIRRDGFVSADAWLAGGTFITPPLTFEGDSLVLNVDLSSGGWLQVEVADAQGRPLDGFEFEAAPVITGNAVDKVVPFAGNLSQLAGTEVRLRFAMREAKMYAFQFRTMESQN